MNTDSKNPSSSQSDVLPTSWLFDDWIDPIESGVRARVRDWIEALVHSELDTALQRPRYGRSTGGETGPAVAPVRGYRNGSRTRTLTGTFGQTDIRCRVRVCRVRMAPPRNGRAKRCEPISAGPRQPMR